MTAPTTPSPERQPADAGGGPVWHRVDGNGATLLYTLRHKSFRRGVPVEVNDLEVRIQASAGSDSDPKPIIQRILAALEAPAPQAQPDARAVEGEPVAWRYRWVEAPRSGKWVYCHDGAPIAEERFDEPCQIEVQPIYLSAPAADDGWRPSREEIIEQMEGGACSACSMLCGQATLCDCDAGWRPRTSDEIADAILALHPAAPTDEVGK